MGVQCDVCFAELSTDEFRELDYRVMHLTLKTSWEDWTTNERIRPLLLANRFRSAATKSHCEVSVSVAHHDFCKTLDLDVVVEDIRIAPPNIPTSIFLPNRLPLEIFAVRRFYQVSLFEVAFRKTQTFGTDPEGLVEILRFADGWVGYRLVGPNRDARARQLED